MAQHFLPASSALVPSYVEAWQQLSAPWPASDLDTAGYQYAPRGGVTSMTRSGQPSASFHPQPPYRLLEWECASPLQPPYQAPVLYGAPGEPHQRMWPLIPPVERSRSPSIKNEARSTLFDPPKAATANVPVQITPVHEFNTAIDNVMRTDEKKEVAKDAQTQRSRRKANGKRFCCDMPGCSKMFAQKSSLNTHRRFHTGESPYVCPYCQRRFTQSVNLGAHQNTYHVEEIEAFNAKLAAVEDKSMISEEDKEMAKYLGDVHNFANKGIKGRGKGRKVKRVLDQSSPTPNPISRTGHIGPYQTSLLPPAFCHSDIAQHSSSPRILPPASCIAQQQRTHHGLPYYGLSNGAAYSMSELPDWDRLSDTSSASLNAGHARLEDEHSDELTFADRFCG
ncbi:hypothetical protein VTG60DRAFT_4092 [Thermothelomyces hinnuleus]